MDVTLRMLRMIMSVGGLFSFYAAYCYYDDAKAAKMNRNMESSEEYMHKGWGHIALGLRCAIILYKY